MLTLTPEACRFVARMLRACGQGPDSGFRLSLRAGGCSGWSVDFSVEASLPEGDSLLICEGARLFLPAATQALHGEFSVDFVDSRMASGFVVHAPGAPAQRCGIAMPAVVSLAQLRPAPRP